MNINLRALVFGIVTAATLTVAVDAVGASHPIDVVRLDAVQVTASRDNFDADANLKPVRLDTVHVTAQRTPI